MKPPSSTAKILKNEKKKTTEAQRHGESRKTRKREKNKASQPDDIAHWVSIQATPYSTGVRSNL